MLRLRLQLQTLRCFAVYEYPAGLLGLSSGSCFYLVNLYVLLIVFDMLFLDAQSIELTKLLSMFYGTHCVCLMIKFSKIV